MTDHTGQAMPHSDAALSTPCGLAKHPAGWATWSKRPTLSESISVGID